MPPYIPPNRYLAGTGLAPYGVNLGFTPKEKRVIKRVNKQRDKRLATGPVTERPALGGGNAGTAAAIAAATATGQNPWDVYLRQLDEREAKARDEAIRASQQSSRNLMSSLGGFGRALQDNAAEAWVRATQGYGAGAAEQGAFQGGIADQYSAGLQAANAKIAQDYAAIGQSGTPTADPNAVAQVASVGGANPAGTMGLVGKAWESYGQTTPGTVGFMTEQNMLQVGREARDIENQIRSEFMQAMADNPQQAMAMWQGVTNYEMAKAKGDADAAQAVIENQYAAAKDAREERAAELLQMKFLADQGKDAWQIAKDMTNFSGNVWGVDKKGQPYDTGRVAPGSRAGTAATSAQTQANSQAITQANNLSRSTGYVHTYDPSTGTITNTGVPTEGARYHDIQTGLGQARIDLSRENLQVAQDREARLARKGKAGYTAEQLASMGKLAASIAGKWYYPVKDPKTGKDVRPVGTPERALREMLSAKIPYSIAWNAIYQYAIQADERRPGWKDALSWNPGYLSQSQKAAIAKGAKNRQSATGTNRR